MEDAPCEVIGCRDRGCWKLQLPVDSHPEDYLCNIHWQLLQASEPDRADCYVPFTLPLASGIEIDTCCDFALPLSTPWLPGDGGVELSESLGRPDPPLKKQIEADEQTGVHTLRGHDRRAGHR